MRDCAGFGEWLFICRQGSSLRSGYSAIISAPASIRLALLLASFAAAALGGLLFWAYEGRPHDVPDAGGGRFASVSFSPYRAGESPLARIAPTSEEIAEDLAVLAGRFEGVRTYASLEGLEAVPRFARPLGMTVMQGIWLGREPEVNEREVQSGIELANRYPDVIRQIVAGNEVMLRRDLSREQLAAYIDRVKAAVKQPVTYADVWEFWLKNPELASHVDFITIHILPYWEDDPVPIGRALDHVSAVLAKVQAAFPGKRVMIGEVGWPSSGRMREGALPSLVNEARLVRGFVAFARANGIAYNLFEAFDESWKRSLEGTVGGHWGLYDEAREAKFALSGPVSDDSNWRKHFALATALAGLAVLVAAWRRPGLAFLAQLALAVTAEIFGSVLTLDATLSATIALSPFARILAGLGLAANLLLAAMFLYALAARLQGERWPAAALPSAREALNLLRGRPQPGPALGERMLGLLQFCFVVAAGAITVALLFDPRYRDFPSEAFFLPAFGFAALALLGPMPGTSGSEHREEIVLIALLLGGAVGVLLREGAQNLEALGWSAVLVLLALPWSLALSLRLGRSSVAVPPRHPQ